MCRHYFAYLVDVLSVQGWLSRVWVRGGTKRKNTLVAKKKQTHVNSGKETYLFLQKIIKTFTHSHVGLYESIIVVP